MHLRRGLVRPWAVNRGAFSGYNVDRFNRQLHPEEKTLAKQLADRSGGKYTQAQIEDQMRIMGTSVNGASESGAPATLVGQMPTDSGARWISGGTTADGKPILTQITAQANPELQSYILANYNAASPGGVPSQFTYALMGDGGGSNNVTGPFTKFDQSDVDSIQSTSSSLASATSLTAGWIASSASTFAAAPSPYAPAFGTVALVATATGVAADGVSQLVNPNIGGYLTYNMANVVGNKVLADKYPLLAPAFNATVNYFSNSGAYNYIRDFVNSSWGRLTGGGKSK
ncbi:hypothetical protein [Burkholderia cepacia]|uniref:hypothetical protein n=1 Tax=Burkholderia cepacia TaxID=292 RepID=UPI0012D8812D|nr:hypothetical protein [Burkholderia cepacia]